MKPLKSFVRRILDATVKQRVAGSYQVYLLGRRIVAAFENHDVDMTSNGERWLVSRLAQRGLKTAIDIGANKGEWSDALLEVAPQARLICFEPVPATFAALQGSIEGPNVTLVNKAVSSKPGTLVIHAVADNPYIASIYAGELYAPELAREAIEIEAVSGDGMLAEQGIDHVDIVKIDAEGHDFDVLQGFGQALKDGRIDAIQFEYNVMTLEAGHSLFDFFKLLSPNYLVCRLLPAGLEACGYEGSLDNFGQSNWVAIRIELLDRDLVRRLSIRRAKGSPGAALSGVFESHANLAKLI